MSDTYPSFGLIIIGDEILSGSRNDCHMANLNALLHPLGHKLSYVHVITDDESHIVHTLQQTQDFHLHHPSAPHIVFCCGGIGATPDDNTRQAAAKAFNQELVSHPQAVRLIEQQFGADAYPQRIRMADLPDDAQLIPNPINQVAGFSLDDHHFFPGFPLMTQPMMAWVLDQHYPNLPSRHHITQSIQVRQCSESAWVDFLQQLTTDPQ